MKVIRDVSKSTLNIENYLSLTKPGERLTYSEIEKQTGVIMDNTGKSYLRSAAKRLKLPYMVIKGVGIETCSPANAMSIISSSVIKIDNSVKRAEKTNKQVSKHVYSDLGEKERKSIDFLGALFGSIRGFSSSAKRIFSKEQPKVGELIKPQ